jgi:hypothetical protein
MSSGAPRSLFLAAEFSACFRFHACFLINLPLALQASPAAADRLCV